MEKSICAKQSLITYHKNHKIQQITIQKYDWCLVLLTIFCEINKDKIII